MKTILPLMGSKDCAIIDQDDMEKVAPYIWRKDYSGYVRATVNKETVALHRFIMNYKKGDPSVDHKNGDKLDNRKQNLRPCIQRLNTCNRPKQWNNKTGFKGVATSKNPCRFRAVIQVKGKQIYLGTFGCAIEAAKEYDKAAKEHFGEFAYLNFSREAA